MKASSVLPIRPTASSSRLFDQMHKGVCPSRLQLQSFVQCRLSDAESEGIIEHLETCEKCDALVTSIEENSRRPPLSSAVAPTFIYQHEPEYQGLLGKVAATRVAGVASTADQTPKIPEIPDYRIIRLIDSGGMGSVFEAEQLETGNRVAIKVLHEGANNSSEALKLFLREADVLSQLTHQSIVRFEGVGKYRNSIFIAMEYIETVDILKRLQSLPVEKRVKLSCGLICQILSALEFAHRKGLVHRDIKPNNVLVTSVDNKLLAKVSDFGLAKSFETAGFSGITREGEARGTLGYMAPEQFMDSRSVKPAADLYSVGITLFYYLTGKLPFGVIRNPADAARVLCLPPTPLSELLPEAPRSLSEIVSRAIEFKPADRFPTAAAFRESLIPFIRPSKT